MPWLVRMVGVVVTLGLVCVSLMMNFRFGQSLGKTEWDGLVYGLASACADGFKVILPFAIMAALSGKRRFAAGAGAALWIVFTAYSMTSSLGHSAVNRAETTGTKQHQIATYKDLRRSLETKLQERERLPSFRALEALQSELKAAEQSYSFERTSGCTETTNKSRFFCDGYAHLKSELATAKRAAAIDRELAELRKSIMTAAEHGTSGENDAQTAILKQISGLAEDYVRLGLTVLVSVMVELGSGLGLYLVLGHRPDTLSSSENVASGGVRWPWHHRSSSEELWRKKRLLVVAGEHEEELTLYRDYCVWLVEQGRGPALTLGRYRDWLAHEQVGEMVRKRGRTYVVGVRLRGQNGKSPTTTLQIAATPVSTACAD